MNNYEILVLKRLAETLEVDKKYNINFKNFSEELKISEENLDKALISLQNERFIDQLVFKNLNDFIISLRQKGFDESQNYNL